MPIKIFLVNNSEVTRTFPRIAKLEPGEQAEISEAAAAKLGADPSIKEMGFIILKEGAGKPTVTKKKKTIEKKG